uniref:INTS6/SAGE1/DDX26B/CT45 C-terminal domain-containing protein n=1 Tax=Colobus angolensis palliatus TaxID=336983 RepID=A0A2K5K6L4_COLAP
MQSSRLRMSQLTPPEELHTVAYVFTNGGPQMRSDEVTPVAKGHRSKKKHSRKSKRHSSSKRRKSMSLWLDKQEGATIWSCCKMGQNTPILQLNLFIWFPDANVTHNVHEEKIKNGQPAPGNVIAAVPTALTNMAGAGISSMSIRDQYAAVTHNIHEEKINNSQPATDNILSTAPPWLGAMAAAGIPSTSMRDLYAAVTHNVHEERINNSQPATNNILSTAPPWLGAMAAAGISSMSMRDLCISLNLFTWLPHAPVNHNRMENGQPQPDNVLSTGPTGLINMAATPFPAMSARDLYATITYNVPEEKMEKGQPQPDNVLSTASTGLINVAGACGFIVLSFLDLFIWLPDEEEMENGQIPPDGLLSNSDSPELINVTGHPMPPNALGSFSYDFTSLSNDELIYKPDINEFAVGTKNYSVSAGDPPVTAMSSVETVPNTPQISPAMAKKINDDIKYQLMKEVRRFGRNYERIFILLGEVQGSMKVKRQFVEFTIKEAARFKKVVLIQQLEKVLKEIDSHCHLRKVKHMRKK